MKKSVLKGLALTLVVILAAVLAACGSSRDHTEIPTVSEGKLTVATNSGYIPFVYHEGDALVGIDPAIAAEIADRMGLELVIEDIDFPEIFEGVRSGQYDIGLAAITITEDRAEIVDFSTPYASGRQAVIVPATSPIRNIYDLINGDYTAGVKTATTGDAFITADIGEERVVRYMHIEDAIDALVRGEVDAVVYDGQAAGEFISRQEGLVSLQTPYAIEAYAAVVPQSNPALLEQVNLILGEMTEDGTLQAIIDEYTARSAAAE
ncbi:MAG: amino acid ABC transporter substrate-binding protein [Lachnospiraceae bacterium]|nr:amino acid ABC transporter substrate-binding protein [Lachnospiraceae bacterium]MBR0402777.1 amino acid ABC transporter substrate-binding protein [Lachnospiraceae bacterium]